MAVIINDMEIVADPPVGAGDGEAALAAREAEAEAPPPPPVSPAVIREVMERESARSLRTFAH